jgi:hypothetical protein
MGSAELDDLQQQEHQQEEDRSFCDADRVSCEQALGLRKT